MNHIFQRLDKSQANKNIQLITLPKVEIYNYIQIEEKFNITWLLHFLHHSPF